MEKLPKGQAKAAAVGRDFHRLRFLGNGDLALFPENIQYLRALAHHHRRDARLDDAGLFAGDVFKGVTQLRM